MLTYSAIICIYATLSVTDRMWHKVGFYVKYSRFELRVFLSTGDPNKAREPSLLNYIAGGGGKVWINGH